MATSETPRLGDFGAGVPALLVNRREPCGIASVTVDDEAGAFVATQYLTSLGHARIGHVAGPQNADTARRRLGGYGRGLEASRDRAVSAELVAESSFDEAGGNVAATRLLRLDAAPDRALRRQRTRGDRRDGGRATARTAASRTTCRSSASTTRRSPAISTRR